MVGARKKRKPGRPPGIKKSKDQPTKRGRKPMHVKLENGNDGVSPKVEKDDGVEVEKEEKENNGVKVENFDDGVKVEENNGVVEKEGEVTNLLKKRLRDGTRRVYYDEDQVFAALFEDDFDDKEKKKKKRRSRTSMQLTPENGNEGEETETRPKKNAAIQIETKKKKRRSRTSKQLTPENGNEGEETETRPKKNAAIQIETKKKKRETEDSNMCHQCQRNDKGRVVNCKSCSGRKRFCIPCITTWYHVFTSCKF